MNRKYLSDELTTETIKEWEINHINRIVISAGTGAGKTTFITKRLYPCLSPNEKILILSNRDNLNKQIKHTVDNYQRIDVKTCQSLQKINDIRVVESQLLGYNYIVIDEAHYFVIDASFNNTTDLLLASLLTTTQTVIFLSATTEPLLNYFQYKGYTAYKLYQFKADYSYIDRVLFYYTKEDIIQFISTKVNSKAKMLYFSNTTSDLEELYQQFKDKALFSVSKSHKKSRLTDTKDMDFLLKKEKLPKNILFSTTALDNGININDHTVKYVVVDLIDIDTIIQCLGRKRIQNDADTITFLIRKPTEFTISQAISNIVKELEQVVFFLANGERELIRTYPRNTRIDGNNILFWDYNDEKEKPEIKINQVAYFNRLYRQGRYQELQKQGMKEILSRRLNIPKEKFGYYYSALFILKQSAEKETLYRTKEEKQMFYNQLNCRTDNGIMIKSASNLNRYFQQHNIPYQIKTISTYADRIQYQTTWKVIAISKNQ